MLSLAQIVRTALAADFYKDAQGKQYAMRGVDEPDGTFWVEDEDTGDTIGLKLFDVTEYCTFQKIQDIPWEGVCT